MPRKRYTPEAASNICGRLSSTPAKAWWCSTPVRISGLPSKRMIGGRRNTAGCASIKRKGQR